MGLFDTYKRTKRKNIFNVNDDFEIVSGVDADSALDYLIGLSEADYKRIIKIANIHRNANKDAAKVLGTKNTPAVIMPGTFGDGKTLLDKDDDFTAPYLEEPQDKASHTLGTVPVILRKPKKQTPKKKAKA